MRLFKATIEHLAIVDKPCAKGATFSFVKNEDEMVFSGFVPFSKVDGDGLIGGLAYQPPFVMDTAGDYMTAEDLRFAWNSFNKTGRVLNLRHRVDLRADQAEVIESVIKSDGSWYVSSRVYDPTIMEAVRKNVLRGYSVGGRCVAVKRLAQPDADIVERTELEEMTAMVKSLLEAHGLDERATTEAQLVEALKVARTLMEDAHDESEMLEALEMCQRILVVLDAEERD